MTASSVTLKVSEHWLTTMTCTVCKDTPSVSPLYKCNLGHMVCMACYSKIAQRGVPRCRECNGSNFRPITVSPEFLQKLKIKPGIGRPRRYNPTPPPKPQTIRTEPKPTKPSTITLEELFGLPQEQLQLLFDENAKCKTKMKNVETKDNHTNKTYTIRHDEGDTERCALDSQDENMIWKIKNRNKLITCDSIMSLSRKPLTCPHSPCGKIIAQSSFTTHFKYEHNEIPRFNLDRGKELHLIHDVSVISHGSSFCLGLVTVYDVYGLRVSSKTSLSLANTARKLTQKIPLCTFWLMVSASSEERKNRSYVIYWMLSNNDDVYHCTLELSSQNENTVCSCFCSTSGMHESLEMDDIAQKMKCLYLTYGSIAALLEEGPKLNFRVTVH